MQSAYVPEIAHYLSSAAVAQLPFSPNQAVFVSVWRFPALPRLENEHFSILNAVRLCA
jgi:hypothetical protein